MNRNNILPYLVLFSALLLAVSAAYFSITGLARLFSGSAVAVIIMASVLELSKIVTASFIHTFWEKIGRALKIYLTTGVVILSIITSIGIYGFLSNAYTITSGKLDKQSGEIEILENKKSIFEEQKTRYEDEINRKNTRISQISNLRNQQESRVDSLYKRGLISSAKNTEKSIKDSETQINQINNEINDLGVKINSLNDSINNLSISVIESQNSDIASEIGPLKFISNITGFQMDSIVNFLILMFVFVFDPLAITLVIASNIAFDKNKNLTPIEPIDIIDYSEKNSDEKKTEETTQFENKEDLNLIDSEPEYFEDTDIDIKKDDVVKLSSDSIEKIWEEIEKEEAKEIGEIKKEDEQDYSESKKEDYDIDFIVNEALQSDLSKSIDKKNIEKYKAFLSVLFRDGSIGVGESIPSYDEFISKIKEMEISFEPKEIKDFLILCNLMKIIYMDDNEKKILRDYEQAKKLLSIIYF